MKVKGLQGYLLFAILGGFVAWMIWGQPKINVDIESYELKIELLEQKIDSINMQNNELKLEADSLYAKITSYDQEIKELNSRIYVIKKQTKQKVDAVDSMFDDELQKFFADRYRQLNDKDSIN
jgi:chromosome segregation ATPase|tara:strand:- start:824 stop:1192 length:369 start_codon:yes stop_codon:yes gene_type:complete